MVCVYLENLRKKKKKMCAVSLLTSYGGNSYQPESYYAFKGFNGGSNARSEKEEVHVKVAEGMHTAVCAAEAREREGKGEMIILHVVATPPKKGGSVLSRRRRA